jgi:hypothetical protein
VSHFYCYAEYHYAQCHYAKCCGAVLLELATSSIFEEDYADDDAKVNAALEHVSQSSNFELSSLKKPHQLSKF